jgi:glycosyltransferase involved in cell wall biosynthesis
MKKIGLITDSVDMAAPGISRYIRSLVRSLLKENEIVKQYEFFLIHENNSNDELYSYPGAKEIIVKAPNIPFFRREIRKIFLLSSALKKYQFSIVHDLANVGPFVFRSNFKKVETIYDLTPIRFPEYHPFPTYYRTKIGLLLIKGNVDYFIAISDNTKKDLIELYNINPHKVLVVPLAVDKIFQKKSHVAENEVFRYNITKPFILFVGTIEPRKNILGIVQAFKTVIKKMDNLLLVIVGKRGWRCGEIVKSLQDNHIVWLENIKDRDLVNLYNAAELLVFPSVYEGFGLPVLEAMSCGCPVLTSDIPVMHEVAGDAAVMVNPRDSSKISEGIVRILADNNLRSSLIDKGLRQSRKFSWERCARETTAIYNKLINI